MSRKGKPATLTSSLLARKGEAEPSRLQDGSVPKDVMALQEELVARVAGGIGPAGREPYDIAPRMPGQAAPKLPIDRVYVGFSAALEREEPAAPQAAPDAQFDDHQDEELEDESAAALFEPTPVLAPADDEIDEVLDGPAPEAASSEDEDEVVEETAPTVSATEDRVADIAYDDIAEDEDDELDDLMAPKDVPVLSHESQQSEAAAEQHAAPAPSELAKTDEPEENEEEPKVTLADWTERIRMLEHHPVVPERDEEEEDEDEKQGSMVPLALSIVAAAALAGFAFWHFASEGEILSPTDTPQIAANEAPAVAPPPATTPGEAIVPTAQPADSLPALGPTERSGTPEPAVKHVAQAKPQAKVDAKPASTPVAAPAASGAYAIQLISTVSQPLAEQGWTQLQPRISGLAGSHQHEIVKADLGAKGVRYRVMLTGFASLADARSACKTVQSKGGACLPMRR
jgi:hypothetical protein